jgi:hypothetical protein
MKLMTETKQARRSEERLIADLEARIAALRARAEAKKAKKSPAIAQCLKVQKGIGAALALAEAGPLRSGLQQARAVIEAALASQGIGSTGAAGAGPARSRRSGGSTEGMADRLHEFVSKNPGKRGEQIAAALATDVGTMRPSMKQLIADKKVKTKGQRRGMTYYPA